MSAIINIYICINTSTHIWIYACTYRLLCLTICIPKCIH